MNLIDRVILEWSYKTKKGYPDINSQEDIALFESIFGFNLLSEKKLEWKDLSSDTRKFVRLEVLATKIKEGSPFKLENGEESVLTFIDDSHYDLFYNQEVDKIREAGGRSINRFPFFQDENGNKLTFLDITKTPDLGGTGSSKMQTSERQEMGLIDAINKFKEKPFTLVGANGEKIENVTGARKMPNPPEGEAYTDVVIETTDGDVNISAKGSSSPSIAGGGLKMSSNLGPEVENFIQDFYEDAYEYYKDIFDKTPEVGYDTNLYKTSYFKDINRAVPNEIMKTVLIGIERFGGPVNGYYIGPMTVESEVREKELHTNGDIISVDKFLEDYPTIYAHIKKRSGDYFFTDKKKPIPANPDIIVPLLFAKSPSSNTAQSRFGMNFKPRGLVII
jgi:hypothetical protein